MLRTSTPYALQTTVLLLGLLSIATAQPHGDDHGSGMGIGAMEMPTPSAVSASAQSLNNAPLNYFRLDAHSGWIYGHIIVMSVTWIVLLPLASVFSVAQSRFALPAQVIFFLANAVGLMLGIIYNAKTPDLYLHNAHHRFGWVLTCFAAAWIVLGVLNIYALRFVKNGKHSGQTMSVANMVRYQRLHQPVTPPRRFSQDSAVGMERNSDSLFGTGSPGTDSERRHFDDALPIYNAANSYDEGNEDPEKRGFLKDTRIDAFLMKNIHRVSSTTFALSKVVYILFERVLVVLGFVALMTGFITFSGIFGANSVFNGLAHWVKGGIFFWYGLLTLGRWMGAYADFGWAWNVKPGVDLVPCWKTRIPSAEFVESFVIALYGITNVWLEHLAAWGSAWHPEDFEHVAITILFFGGGVLGMLIESNWIRELLSTHIVNVHEDIVQHAPSTSEEETWKQPNNYHVPLNPMPALVILLLGIMMSSHTQESMTSSMIHKQWGQLFVGYALARGATYLLLYIKPYTSYLPSRPPTEIIASFCLVGGGLVFMASARDIVEAMEYNHLDAMFGFTITMGLTALLLAWTVILIAIKGWAVRKEKHSLFQRHITASQQI